MFELFTALCQRISYSRHVKIHHVKSFYLREVTKK